MNRNRFELRHLVAGFLALSALTVSAHAQACPDIVALVDAGLPGDIGDVAKMRALLHPAAPPAAGSPGFDRQRVEKAVRANGFTPDPDSCCSDEKCVYRNKAGEVIRLKKSRGKATFLSHVRSSELDENVVPEAAAIAQTRAALSILGVPEAEIDLPSIRAAAIEETMADVPSRTAGPSVSRRSEVLVRLARHIAGTPVEGSKAGAAIAPSGEIARLKVTWPKFEVAPGLDEADTMSRAEVLRMVADELTALNPCGSLSAVDARIAYIPEAWVQDAGDADTADHDEGEPHPARVAAYLPALKVFALPVEQLEDSGVVQDAGLILYLPLLRSGETATPVR